MIWWYMIWWLEDLENDAILEIFLFFDCKILKLVANHISNDERSRNRWIRNVTLLVFLGA